MSVVQKVMETVIKVMPDAPTDPLIDSSRVVGQPLSRVDGPLKVAGAATFTAEYTVEGAVYGALVCSTIARGRIKRFDLSKSETAPGVVAIMTHENAPKMKPPVIFGASKTMNGAAASGLPVMQDDRVSWNGQPVALVMAETQEQADEAAALLGVEYESEPADLSVDALREKAHPPKDILGEPPEVKVGDAEAGLREAAVRVDHEYRTPRYHHNAIELHATIARWDGDDQVTLYDASQTLSWFRDTIAEVFALKPDQVRVIAPFVGGGFGGKGMMWNHTLLCIAAAKVARRPVKLVLTREQVFRVVGGRTLSEQRVALGARGDGTLVSLIHTGLTAVVTHNAFPEQFSFPARHLYGADNLLIAQKIVELDMVANTAMRAPGESIGTFALESAVDELAWAADIDPIELRARIEPEIDPTKGTPFSSRQLMEAYRRGAERFGWFQRNRALRSQRDGEWLIGQGVATAYYPYFRFPASARVRITAGGRAIVQCAAHEMGMGTATAQAQHAAERLGLSFERVTFEYGDSWLPDSPTAGGSTQSVSIMAAVIAATEKVVDQLIELAGKGSPLAGAKAREVQLRDGGVYLTDKPDRGETYEAILRRAGRDHVEGEAKSPQAAEMVKYSMHSYGAQFCEVRVNEVTGEVCASRWLGSFDTGRILNPKTARSQFRGGIIMGIGMALMEESNFDERNGRFINASLAEYHVPVHRDVPHIDVIWNDISDPRSPMGARGIGEIGITGCAAAIANAVYHATGKRIRELPITLDKVLAAEPVG